MLGEKKLGFDYLPYGDVCKRSHGFTPDMDETEYEEFERELMDAVNEANLSGKKVTE